MLFRSLSGKYRASAITAGCKPQVPPRLEIFLRESPALTDCLDHQALHLGLDGADLVGKLTGVVGGDGHGDHGTADTTGTAKSHLGGNVDVGDVLVLAQKGEVENDGQRGGAMAYISMKLYFEKMTSAIISESLTRQQGRRAQKYHGSESWWSYKGEKVSNHHFMNCDLVLGVWLETHMEGDITYSLAPFLTWR